MKTRRFTRLKKLLSGSNVLILILVATFHHELLALSIRSYVYFSRHPTAELFLGDYYRTAAKQNTDDANYFFKSSLQQYEDSLRNRTPKTPTFIQPRIAYYYECGKGTKINYDLARQWYEQALRISDPEWKAKVHSGLLRIHEAKYLASPPAPCPYLSHPEQIGQVLNDIISIEYPRQH
jgi:hypothetical protein